MGTPLGTMINIAFKFHNRTRKDGTNQLQIRIRKAAKEKVISTGIYIDKSKWNKVDKMVRSSHPEAPVINKKLSEYHNKIKRIKPKYELGQITFETAYLMLTSSGSIDSIEAYVKNFCDKKSEQWRRNTKGALNAFKIHAGLDEVRFQDVTKENIYKMMDAIAAKGGQPDTHNNYVRHIRAVYNKALEEGATYREFKFSKSFFQKTNRHDKKLLTNNPRDIAYAIEKITIKSNHRSAKGYAIRDIEAIGFWLLKFALRGMYGKDIVSLSAFNYAFNYRQFISHQKLKAVDTEYSRGNPYFLDHKRHKTGNMMRIWINLPPIGGLIYVLRRLVAQTHPNLSYLKDEDLKKPYEQLIQKPDYDELKIFKHDSKKGWQADDSLWNNLNKHLRKLDLHSFESARKSFNTTASILGIEEGIKKTLIGQTDHGIQSHYINYNDPLLQSRVQLAHLRIMHEFKIIELYELWLKKIDELFGPQNPNLKIGASSDEVYNDQYLRIKELLNESRIEVDKKPFWVEKYDVSKRFKAGNLLQKTTRP